MGVPKKKTTKPASSHWFESTNKIVFDTLKKGLLQEKKEISRSEQKSKELKLKVEFENKQIEQQKKLTKELEAHVTQLKTNTEELHQKEQLIKNYEQKLALVLGGKKLTTGTKGKQDTEHLSLLIKKEKVNIVNIKKKRDELNTKIQQLEKRKTQIGHQVTEAIGLVAQKTEPDSLFKNLLTTSHQKIAQYEQKLAQLERKEKTEKNKVVTEIESIKKEVARLQKQKHTLEHDIEQRSSGLINIKLLEKKREEYSILVNDHKNRLDSLLKIINYEKAQKDDLSKKIKQDLHTIFDAQQLKQAKEVDARRKLALIKSDYKEKLTAAVKNKSLLDKKIADLEQQKKKLIANLQEDQENLNRLKHQLLGLEKKLRERELEGCKEQELAKEIELLSKEKEVDEQKLTKVGSLVKQVKETALKEPGIMINLEKEKSRLQNIVQKREKDIASRKNEIVQLRVSISTFKKEFSEKKEEIYQLQRKWTAEKNKHEQLLHKLSNSLSLLQKELADEVKMAGSLDSLRKKKMINIQFSFDKDLEEIRKTITLKKQEYKRHLSALDVINEHFKDWEHKKNMLTVHFEKNKNVLSDYDHNLDVEREKRRIITNEETLLRNIIAKLDEDEKRSETIKGSSKDTITQLDRQRAKLKEELAHYIISAQQKAKVEGEQKLKETEKAINALKNKYVSISTRWQEEKKKGSQEISLIQKIIPLKHSVATLDTIIPEVKKKLRHEELEKEKIEVNLSQHEKNLKKLEEISKEKEQHVKEKELLRIEIQKLYDVIEGKIVDVAVTRKAGIGKEPFNVNEKKELKVLLLKIDSLLGKLPAKEIDLFSRSKYFKKYKTMMNKYGVK